MNELLGTIGVSVLVASITFLYYARTRIGHMYPSILSHIVVPVVAGLLVFSTASLLLGEGLLSLVTGIIGSFFTILPLILAYTGYLRRIELDPYTWAVEVERRLAEPGPLNCEAIRTLFVKAHSPQYYDALAGILYDHYLRDPGEFIAMVSSLTRCAPTRCLELHKRLTRLIVVEGESGIPYAYARLILSSYNGLELPVEIIDYLTNACMVACTSYGRIDSNCIELVVETLDQYAHLCIKKPELARHMLVDFLKNIRGQIIVRKTSGGKQVGISIANRIITYRENWEKLLPCLERTEEKIMI